VSPAQQRVFDRGHAIEAAKRPVAEAIIGEDLFPVVGSAVVGGIELSASFDGLTMMEDTNWECKTLNANLRAILQNSGPDGNDGCDLPKHYRVQMQQQCMVSSCTRVLFTASDGQDDDRHCWYYSDLALAREIIAAWRQFDLDLAAYVPPVAAPVLLAAAQETLPAVSVKLDGSIAIIDNLDVFGVALTAYIGKINKSPQTDQDFVDLKAVVTTLEKAEAALDAAEGTALASIASVNAMQSAVSTLRALTKQNRLLCEKIYKAENERRKLEIVQGGRSALATHIADLNDRLDVAQKGTRYMPDIAADFTGVAKNLRTLASLQNAVDTELARVKIQASAIADKVQANFLWVGVAAKGYEFLFADTATIVLKATDDFNALLMNRIALHQASEADRLEKERERIRGEEVAKLAHEQADRDQVASDLERRNTDIANIKAAPPQPTITLPSPTAGSVAAPITFTGIVVAMPRRTVEQGEMPTLKLGEISTRLGFTLTAEFLRLLGFEPAATDKTAKLYHEANFRYICAALVDHIDQVQARAAA
jgi:predicted phage-related endonuclease